MIFMDRTLYKSIIRKTNVIYHNCIVCREQMLNDPYKKNLTFCRIVHWECKI